jgi:serine/threonine-protein kinase/endoribonuclease IRE1
VRSGNLIWSRDLPHPVVSVFDVYRREDYTIALSKQDPPQSLTKGAVGDLLSLMTAGRKNGMTTAYVGVHEGSLYALSTKNYPLVQISPWASMYTGRKPGDTANPLIEGSSSSDNSSGYEWTQKPHEMCCHGCEYHIDCMIGQHVVQSVVDDIVEEDRIYRSKLSLPSGSSASATSLPSVFPPQQSSSSSSSSSTGGQLPHYHQLEEYRDQKTGFFHDGFGKFWKSYILVSSVIVYIYRDRMLTFYEVKVLPRWKQMMKKRAKAKKTKARIAAAARAEREKINRERARSDSLTSIGSFDADRYIKEKIDEQIYEKEQERKKLREQEEVEEKKKKQEEMAATAEKEQQVAIAAKEAEEKLSEKGKVVVVKKSSTGLDLKSFKQSKSRVLEISDHVLGKFVFFFSYYLFVCVT